MEVSDFSVFLSSIKPNIEDIDKVKLFLDQSNQEYDELTDLITYCDNDEKKIITYHNQDIIYSYLNMIGVSENTYNAIKYLVANDNPNIKEMPQYVKAIKNLNTIFGSIDDRRKDISERVDILSYSYTDKYIAKKYYDMFANDNIYVVDPLEFTNFIKRLDIDNNLRIDILKTTINKNINHYYNNDENKITEDVLKTYNHYLTNKYISMIDNANKYIDLSLDIGRLLEIEQNYFTRTNLILLKRIWLVNEIKNSNGNIKYIDELNTLVRYEE